jgi:hypothetical protein
MPVINPLVPEPEPPEVPAPGPCDWPIDVSCCPDWITYTANVQVKATAWATEILDALTGRRFSQCAVNYRPCGPKCDFSFGYLTWPVNASANGGGFPWMTPWIDSGVWRNCGCAGGCSCRAACEVPFPTSVASIVEVRIDGVVLDPTAYRLDSYRMSPVLVRIDGECWPQCQDMALGTDEAGAFVIVYRPGDTLPVAGQLAAGELACEFAKACVGSDCALPQQLQSLSRNGVEVQVVDPTAFLDQGLTGLANVDLWIRSVNPRRKQQRARVYSSDLSGPRFSG